MKVSMVIYECDGGSVKGLVRERDFALVTASEPDARVVHEFEAVTWHEANQVYYDFFGFGKYVPFGDDVFLATSMLVQKDVTFPGEG